MMKTIYSTVNTRRFFPFLSTLVAVSLMMVVACNITESEPDSGPPNLSVTPAALHFAYGGGEQTITITSNISWAITTPPNWIEVSEKFNAGNAIITVTAPPFDTGELAREGSFTVRTAEGLEATVTIAQGGVPLVTTETSVSNITDITAELSGSWVFSDPVTISEAGVWVKRTGSADSVKFTVAAPSDTPGPFTVTATDLQHSANYTYRAYVITSGGNYAPSKTTGTFTTAEVLSIRQFLSDAGAGSITTNQLKQVTTNSYILATVLSDYSKGNYEPDRLVLTDVLNGAATPQDALILAFNAADAPSNTYTLGHQLKIHLQNSSLYRDADGVLVDSISITAIEVLSGSATTVTPTIVTDHTQLIDYESVYVKVENTQLSQAMLTAPSWYNVPRLRFEVDGNENTYMVDVLHAAEFANTAPATGSGAIYGIVTKINATEYVVRPRNEADINQLIGDRFVSQAAFKLTDAILSGTLKKNLPSAATVTVAYENSNGTTSQIIDIADVWGVSGAYTGILPLGNGTWPIALSGTPTESGAAAFTVVVAGSTNTVSFIANVLDLTFTGATVTGEITVGEPLAATLALSYTNAKDYIMPAISVKSDNGTIVGSRAAGSIPETTDDGIITIALSGVTPTNTGSMNFTVTAGDYAVPIATAIVNPKEFIITDMQFTGSLEVDEPSAGSVTFTYKGADSGQEVPYIITLSGSGSVGLTSPLNGTYTIAAAGSGSFSIPVTGTPTEEGEVVFTVTGLSAYGLADGSTCTAIVISASGMPFTLRWILPTGSSGANGPCTAPAKPNETLAFDAGSSSLAGLATSACTFAGFPNGANYGSAMGGSIPCGNSTVSLLAYAGIVITVPTGSTLNVETLSGQMRLNNQGGQRIGYIVYSINGAAFQLATNSGTSAPITVALGNSANTNVAANFDLSTDDNLQGIAGGSTLEIRIVPTTEIDNTAGTAAAWTINGASGSAPLTITGKVQ